MRRSITSTITQTEVDVICRIEAEKIPLFLSSLYPKHIKIQSYGIEFSWKVCYKTIQYNSFYYNFKLTGDGSDLEPSYTTKRLINGKIMNIIVYINTIR